MRHQWLAQSDDSKLTLVFGGWALGSAPFRGLTGGGSVLLVDDYTGLDDPLLDLAGLSEPGQGHIPVTRHPAVLPPDGLRHRFEMQVRRQQQRPGGPHLSAPPSRARCR